MCERRVGKAEIGEGEDGSGFEGDERGGEERGSRREVVGRIQGCGTRIRYEVRLMCCTSTHLEQRQEMRAGGY